MLQIVVIEDESIIARDICRVIEKLDNFKVTIADSFDSAINIIDEIIPDLILIDIKLYDDDEAGLRIAQYLNGKYRIPFIFLSGYSTEQYLIKAKREKPITFITKPIDNNQLQVAVLMAINEDKELRLRHIYLTGRLIIGFVENEITHHIIKREAISNEKIDPNDILIIKTFNHVKRNTILIKLATKKVFISNSTVNEILRYLPSNFIKIHSSYIVNRNHVSGSLGKSGVRIGEEYISFGTQFKKDKKYKFF